MLKAFGIWLRFGYVFSPKWLTDRSGIGAKGVNWDGIGMRIGQEYFEMFDRPCYFAVRRG
jgi:hypothetical protein